MSPQQMATVASSTAGYVWEDPGDSIIIQVSLDLVERLGNAIQQGLGTGSRGTEIGGILLGRALPGFGRAVLVEDFELVPCEHLRGGSYTLSFKDRQYLGPRLARRRSQQVVGYFRSHTRPGLYLDQDDFAVFSQYFPDSSQVFLLVRPSTTGPATGGFFFWEEGDVNRRSPYREFPFDGARLVAGDFPINAGQVTATAPAPRLAPVAVLKPTAKLPREPRRMPQLSWMVVPLIGGIFLIAGLFVSVNRGFKREAAPVANASLPAQPVEQFVPKPVPQAAEQPVAVPQTPQAEPAPVTVPVSAPAHKRPIAGAQVPMAPPPAPVKTIRPSPREVETPPALRSAVHPDPWTLLPASPNTAPPPPAEVTYEQPHLGVFRRAFHKNSADVPASPVSKVAPPAAVGTGVVDVKVSIDESGNVTHAQMLTKRSDAADQVLNAARQWRFTPALKHDKPVASEMVLHFHF